MENELKDYIEDCLIKSLPFAIFRFPSEKEYHISGREGFRISINGFNKKYSEAKVIPGSQECELPTVPDTTDKEDYLKAVKETVSFHRGKNGGKTVLSRVIAGKTDVTRLTDAAEKYFDDNPSSFCLMSFMAPDKVWLMATPELLLKTVNGKYHTVALAGTRPAQACDVPWDVKNRDEQQMVADYIQNCFERLGMPVLQKQTETVRSGNIEHICTRFTVAEHENSFGEILDELSPTPAVCGFPMEAALEKIHRLETHERGLYAGYTAVRRPSGDSEAYVNLRGAIIDVNTGRFAIYVGSGVTADSEPEDEFNETMLKGAPLKNRLENFY